MPHLFPRPHGPSLSYHKIAGRSPAIVFLHGFHSDKDGQKPQYLAQFCKQHDLAFYAFDHSGHGQSEGNFEEGTIGQWRQDTCDMLDHVIQGPVIAVGSSMGGWMALLAALDRAEHIVGMVGIAAAPDFTTRLITPNASPEQHNLLKSQGYFLRPSAYGPPYPITQKLIEESQNHTVMKNPIELNIPTVLLHGMRDVDVPYTESIELAGKITGQDVEVILRKMGDHRLSEADDLTCLGQCLERMIQKINI